MSAPQRAIGPLRPCSAANPANRRRTVRWRAKPASVRACAETRSCPDSPSSPPPKPGHGTRKYSCEYAADQGVDRSRYGGSTAAANAPVSPASRPRSPEGRAPSLSTTVRRGATRGGCSRRSSPVRLRSCRKSPTTSPTSMPRCASATTGARGRSSAWAPAGSPNGCARRAVRCRRCWRRPGRAGSTAGATGTPSGWTPPAATRRCGRRRGRCASATPGVGASA